MIIDSKGKLFGKVSIIDIIIVLVVVAAVAGVGYKMTKPSGSPITAKKDNVVVTFYSEEAPEYAVKATKVGDIVKDFDKGTLFGKLKEEIKTDKALSFTDFTEYVDGQWIVGSKPGYCSYYMKVEATAIANTDGSFSFGNENYYVGRGITIKVGGSVFTGRIYSIEKE
jgi:hypothetical protein